MAKRLISVETIAMFAHEANRIYCATIGDHSQPVWAEAPDWQRNSAINGVEFVLANPDADEAASHDSWMAEKIATGWIHGEVKDESKKTHPCIRPYSELPREQQAKDRLFRAIVRAFRSVI